MIALEILARAKGGEAAKSGPIGLAVILVLCVVAYFLFKSMSKHLRRVRDNFPADQPAAPRTQARSTPGPAPMADSPADSPAEPTSPPPPAARPPDSSP